MDFSVFVLIMFGLAGSDQTALANYNKLTHFQHELHLYHRKLKLLMV